MCCNYWVVGTRPGPSSTAPHAAEAVQAENAQCCFALAEHLRRRGEYGAAAAMLARAQEMFAAVDDATGLATTYSTAGTLAAQQGRYDRAQAEYGRAGHLPFP
ncbi:MAG: tetratricopeptide repeat protein [Caldilineaceae bacterium]